MGSQKNDTEHIIVVAIRSLFAPTMNIASSVPHDSDSFVVTNVVLFTCDNVC